jgi:thiosulfate dehydrogenase [quinone] large subunit
MKLKNNNLIKSKKMNQKIIKLFLRFTISIGFLSAVADRFGLWNEEISAWGNWENFLSYKQLINPLMPNSLIPLLGITATLAEIILGLCLLVGFKTEFAAKLSGYVLFTFALAMMFSTGVKGVFDYSVLIASAGAFSLSLINEKYLEIDNFFHKKI